MQTLPKSIIKFKKLTFTHCYIYLFIFGFTGSLLLHMGFLQLWRARATLQLWLMGFLQWWLLLWGSQTLGAQLSVVAACGLSSCNLLALACMAFSSCSTGAHSTQECAGYSNCGTWSLLLHSMWNLSGPWIEPVSSSLAGRSLSTVPPEKSKPFLCKCKS